MGLGGNRECMRRWLAGCATMTPCRPVGRGRVGRGGGRPRLGESKILNSLLLFQMRKKGHSRTANAIDCQTEMVSSAFIIIYGMRFFGQNRNKRNLLLFSRFWPKNKMRLNGLWFLWGTTGLPPIQFLRSFWGHVNFFWLKVDCFRDCF